MTDTIKVIANKETSDLVTEVTELQLSELLKADFPDWAGLALADFFFSGGDDRDADRPIELQTEKNLYEIIDADEGANQSGVGGCSYDAYGSDDDDSEDAADAWLDEIEENLIGHIATNRDNANSEFLIKVS